MRLAKFRPVPVAIIGGILFVIIAIVTIGRFTLSSTQMSGGASQAFDMPAAEPAADYAEAELAAEYDGGDTATDSLALERQGQLNEAPSPSQQQNRQDLQRLVIKNANLSLEVEDVRAAETAVRTRVDELGGYIVSVETSGTDEQLTSRVTFRVPAERFDEALSGVQGLAEKVLSRTVSGDDVTEEFVDLESRLTNLEATRDRLLDLLTRANRVEDALQVNTALSDVQGQIEQIRGRMEYLEQSAALSTVSVYLSPVPITPIVQEGSWQPLAVARAALRDLIEMGQGLVNAGIVVLVWTPVWLPLLLIGRWGWRKIRSRTRTTSGPTPSEAA